MEDLKEKTADLLGHVEDVAETWQKLTVLKLTQKTADISSAIIMSLILFIAALFVLLLGGLALSWWLGDMIDSRAGGFLLGAAFFLLVALLLYISRKKLLFPQFRDRIVRKLYD